MNLMQRVSKQFACFAVVICLALSSASKFWTRGCWALERDLVELWLRAPGRIASDDSANS